MRTYLPAFVAIFLATASCSSDEFESGSSGGSSGAAGASGSAGAGGGTGGLPASCTDSSECDDKLACNGKETCEKGKCVAGTAVSCPNPDPAHCVGECTEAGGGNTTCVVKGLDADKDTYLDAACTASSVTADDCDDSNKDVHPGAKEECDGVDNDCNGKDELDEGVTPKGTTGDFIDSGNGDNYPAIAWSPVSKHYGVVWVDSAIRYVRMSPEGKLVGSPVEVAPTFARPRIAWSGAHFGVVWTLANKVYFRRVAPEGTFPEAAQVISGSGAKPGDPDIAAAKSGWVAVWSDLRDSTFGTLYARAVGTNGTTLGGTDTQVGALAGSNKWPAIAANGNGFFVAQERGASSEPNLIQVFDLSAALAVSGEKAVSANPPPAGPLPNRPVVAATDTGWAVAWAEEQSPADKIRYYEQKANGAPGCAPVAVAAPPTAIAGAIAVRGRSRVVVYGQDSATTALVQLTRFKEGCASPSTHKVSDVDLPDWIGFGTPAAAWSDRSLVILWPDQSTGVAKVRRWVSGPNLCDAPVP